MGEGADLMTDDQMTGVETSTDDVETTDDEQEVARKAAEIEATREEMTDTVVAIGDRLDPANIVQDAKQTVRDATVGKVDDMAQQVGSTISDVGQAAQTASGGLMQTIRENPIPAAMAAVGIGWLVTHRSSGSSTSGWSSADSWRGQRDWAYGNDGGRYAGSGYSGSGYTGYSGSGYGTTGDGGSTGQGLTDSLQQRAGDVGDQLQQRAGDVGDALGTVPSRIGTTAEGAMGSFQRLLDESPLAVGAAAVAAGAAIGMALPPSRFEQDTLGTGAQKLIGTAEQSVTDALQQARSETETAGATSSTS